MAIQCGIYNVYHIQRESTLPGFKVTLEQCVSTIYLKSVNYVKGCIRFSLSKIQKFDMKVPFS